jgi:hypothetical protein
MLRAQLSATGPLISLLNSSPTGPLIPAPLSLLPQPVIPSSRIPALIPEASEPPLYPLLPVTKTFLASLQKAWRMKDAGGGTSGSGETSSSRSMRLHHLLREMARKYDQYDDYMQQDAHELLRHLLDSMEMEEKDIIKRVQPPMPHEGKSKKHKDGISPLPSAAASPSASAPASPTKVTFTSALHADNSGSSIHSASIEQLAAGEQVVPREIPEEERLVPFVDVLFGGLLASVVVCEHCKSVRQHLSPSDPPVLRYRSHTRTKASWTSRSVSKVKLRGSERYVPTSVLRSPASGINSKPHSDSSQRALPERGPSPMPTLPAASTRASCRSRSCQTARLETFKRSSRTDVEVLTRRIALHPKKAV